MFLIEYALLGAATAAFGVGAGALAAWLVVTQIMRFPFIFAWAGSFAAAAGGLAVTVGFGMIGAWRVLSQKPAAYLREL
jgi:putative ABC transport system permease protein